MEIPKTYDPSKTEDKWYNYWMENDFFKSTPDEFKAFEEKIDELLTEQVKTKKIDKADKKYFMMSLCV